MHGHNEHITHYSAADIQQYLQGKLSAQEMHAMEKAALDDPFLADAIEGMEQALKQHSETDIAGKLQEAKQHITNRIKSPSKKARVIAFRWWQIAAAAVVIVVSTLWIYSSLDSDEKNVAVLQVVQNTVTDSSTAAPEEAKAMDTLSHDSVEAGAFPADYSATQPAEKESKKKDKYISGFNAAKPDTSAVLLNLQSEREDVKILPAPPKQAPPRKMEEVVLQQDTQRKQDTVGAIKTRSELSGKVAGPGYEENKMKGYISGRVINQNNMPLPNASVFVENYRNNFVTDKGGTFKIPVAPDTTINVSVAVAGYNTQRFRLQNNVVMFNQLQMQNFANAPVQRALEYKADKNRAKDNAVKEEQKDQLEAKLSTGEAAPLFGWITYQKYLEENIRKPDNDDALSGEVIVSFMVGKKGELSNFKIEQSLGEDYDNEAIRLIKEGPRWKSLKGRKSRISIIVRF